ncbi:outer membrane lipoprotein LolB [Niveibacterium sp. 24ML]|uniref:outer membrane lipoprotein LolB n=1 Tax=Niveibacterium sp. 24ML TaxID=2985512 RepID=UPI002270DC79|nr:outer membrane lipoprotein LolB [Niveibacterium sp. 24ML]MCX9155566.1 outer membrane lipoprotein LolB [Niveibacterium sp. 24ML]
MPPLPAPLAQSDFSMSGRVLVRQAERADVLRLYWSHRGESDDVRLETPLGQTLAELSMGQGFARARLGDGREFEAADDSALASQVIGTALPLRRFAGWLQAEPGGAASQIERDAAGRVLTMSDAGWRLSYAGHGDVVSLDGPSLIEAKREDVLVRIKIETWVRGGVE